MPDKPTKLTDIDTFWELDDLLPAKRKPTVRRELNTDAIEIELDNNTIPPDGGAAIPARSTPISNSERTSAHDEARRLNELSMRTKAQSNEPKPLEPYLIYEPNTCIKRVSVAKWQTRYNFYEKFHADAHKLWDRAAAECEPTPFFSYIPQYNQLHYAQLKWYLWWRQNVRAGKWLPTDYSYILLFIYEIINCPDLIAPEQGLELLCDVWLHYRSRFPRIDNYLCEWLCDYCLIYQLPCPAAKLEPILKTVISAASFKEFYMEASRRSDGAAGILAYSSNYDWRTSRYVTKENIALFSEHIRGAFDRIYHELLIKDERIAESSRISAQPATLTRDAYSGALCVYDMKRSITIDYISYTRSPKFRFLVTDIIKYSENRIRMALGIKPRLKVEELTDEMKRCIDEYFDEQLPAPKKSKSKPREEAVSSYDSLYEPTYSSFSLENALEIEKSSWSTTEILTAAFDDAGEPQSSEPSPSAPEPPEPTQRYLPDSQQSAAFPSESVAVTTDSGDEFKQLTDALEKPLISALRAALTRDADSFTAAASDAGMLPDALADRINEVAFDIIGDSVLEPDGSTYKLITDYEDDLKKWLN